MGASAIVVLLLWGVFGISFATGQAAMLLRDNRAFCKYLYPLAVPMKIGARF